MHPFFQIGPRIIPGYGLMIVLGVLVANAIAYFMLKRLKLNFENLLVIEGYIFIAALVGTKLVFLIVEFNNIQWNRLFELEYLKIILSGGFVFYGGLIAGLLVLLIPWKVHKIDIVPYAKHLMPLIPLAHAFGRVGCFLAGCCYGMEYDGPFAVTFPMESLGAPGGVPRFPSQLVEAVCLVVICVIGLIIERFKDARYTIPFYLITYAIVRFVLEYFRGDLIRGHAGAFSTSQWISIGMIIVSVAGIIYVNVRERKAVAQG